MSFIVCKYCNKKISDQLVECPFCKKTVSEGTEPLPSNNDVDSIPSKPLLDVKLPQKGNDFSSNKGSNRNFRIIIVLSVTIILTISSIVFFNYYKKEAMNKGFGQSVERVSNQLTLLAVTTEDIVNLIAKSWRDAIYKQGDYLDYYADYNDDWEIDFNDAIYRIRTHDKLDDIKFIELLLNDLGQEIKKLVVPTGKERDSERLKEIYLLFSKYADMAISPSGSLQTYSQHSSDLKVEIKSAMLELELMK